MRKQKLMRSDAPLDRDLEITLVVTTHYRLPVSEFWEEPTTTLDDIRRVLGGKYRAPHQIASEARRGNAGEELYDDVSFEIEIEGEGGERHTATFDTFEWQRKSDFYEYVDVPLAREQRAS